MKTVLTIIKKEFARFFKDTRLWLTALILPGLLIFAMYNIMGIIIESKTKNDDSVVSTAYVVNMPESYSPSLSEIFDLKQQDYTYETATEALKEGALDLIIVFPEDETQPKIGIYFNSSETKSQAAYSLAVAMVANYNLVDVADAQSVSRTVLSTVVPMVLLMLLFSGCMAVAPESIAGEKERGTIATLLVTPVKRSVVAVGKISALSIIALLSGLSSALGMMLSLPKLAGSASGISLSMYGFGDYAAILGVILSTVLILIAVISIVSAYAKSVKEANGLVVPIMIVVMLCGVFSMFAGAVASIGLYFIPVFNSALVISTILSGTVSAAGIAITICVNIAFAALLVFVLTRMFNSERIMFNR
ncbi:MAG: ABC transporter permease subunit [Clostridia bacterium]|nr:ABC transporter permease subunit [Clostridia bacterium]